MVNRQEKIFSETLKHYKDFLYRRRQLFYWYRPADPSEVRKFSMSEKPCDFWFFDVSFKAIECKYTSTEKITNSKIKPHQIESLSHFAINASFSYLFLTMMLAPKKRITSSKSFAVDIRDYVDFRLNYRKSLAIDNVDLWKGIPIEYDPKLKIFNLDPIIYPSYRIF